MAVAGTRCVTPLSLALGRVCVKPRTVRVRGHEATRLPNWPFKHVQRLRRPWKAAFRMPC